MDIKQLSPVAFAQKLMSRFQAKPTGVVSLLLADKQGCLLSSQSDELVALSYQDVDDLTAKLIELWAKNHWQGAAIFVVLTEPLYKCCSVEKPSVPDAEMAQAVMWAAKDFFTEPIHDLVLDYVDIPVPGAGKPKVQVYGVPRHLVQQLSKTFSKLGVLRSIAPDELGWIDLLEASPLGQLVIYRRPKRSLELVAVIDGRLCFSRQFRGTEEFGADPQALNPLDIDGISLEIQRSIDYIVSQLKLADVKRICLAFELETIEVVRARLEETLAIETVVLKTPMEHSDPDRLLVSASYQQAIRHEKSS